MVVVFRNRLFLVWVIRGEVVEEIIWRRVCLGRCRGIAVRVFVIFLIGDFVFFFCFGLKWV